MEYYNICGRTEDEELPLSVSFGHKKGPVPIYVEFPEIIEEIEHLIIENGIAADKRRRNDQVQYFGTSLRLIQEHSLSVIQILIQVSSIFSIMQQVSLSKKKILNYIITI